MVRDLTSTPIFQFLKLIKVLISRDPRLLPRDNDDTAFNFVVDND